MPRFVKLAIASGYAYDGTPELDDDQWVNLDLVLRVRDHLGNNAFHRRPDELEQHFPCLVLECIDGSELIVPLGIAYDVEEGLAMLHKGATETLLDDQAGDGPLYIPAGWQA
jgi:hypothetical protein